MIPLAQIADHFGILAQIGIFLLGAFCQNDLLCSEYAPEIYLSYVVILCTHMSDYVET